MWRVIRGWSFVLFGLVWFVVPLIKDFRTDRGVRRALPFPRELEELLWTTLETQIICPTSS